MDPASTHLDLRIELESEPIAGSVGSHGAEQRTFNGWIELVEVIEKARRGAAGHPNGNGVARAPGPAR